MQAFKKKFIRVITKRYRSNSLKVIQIATELTMSERQLQRKTRQYFDTSPSTYLLKFRLRKATELLKNGTIVRKAGFDVGFNSYSYFARRFKQEFGCSAGDFLICEICHIRHTQEKCSKNEQHMYYSDESMNYSDNLSFTSSYSNIF